MPKVLIIDDSDAVLATLETVLVRADYEVVVADTGAEGLARARSARPDLILLDWVLPDADGAELLQRIRTFSDVPCIMITGRDAPEHCVEALEAGFDDFIAKPIRPDELLLRLSRLLGFSAPK